VRVEGIASYEAEIGTRAGAFGGVGCAIRLLLETKANKRETKRNTFAIAFI